MKTLQLTEDWDLARDAAGSLVVLSDNKAALQDVCSAARTWLGEVLYNTDIGIPYDDDILSSDVDISFYSSEIENQAMSVPGVISATCYLANPTRERQLLGAIHITFNNGSSDYVAF